MLNLDFLNSPNKEVENYQYDVNTCASDVSKSSSSFNVFQEYADSSNWTPEYILPNSNQNELSVFNHQSFSQPLPERQLPLSEISNFQNFANVCQPSQVHNEINNYSGVSENVDMNLK